MLSFFICMFSIQATTYFPRLYSFFGGYPYQQSIEQKYTLTKGSLTILNPEGNIVIQTGRKGNSLYLKATKHAKKVEDLQYITITGEYTNKNDFLLKSEFKKQLQGAIDISLIIPENMPVTINATNGSININQISGPITAKTTNGSIEITNATESIDAQIKNNGSIAIINSPKNIYAMTEQGNISIENAKSTIFAHTKKGIITTSCSQVPSNSHIFLTSLKGGVNLALPESVNAQLHANTKKGSLSCELYLTLNPQTIKLNSESWKNFKREAHGLLGKGNAEIRITCDNGNIKILEKTSL